MAAEGSEERLGGGGPGINSLLPTSGKCLTISATDVATWVATIWMSVLMQCLISPSDQAFQARKAAGSRELEKFLRNMLVQSGRGHLINKLWGAYHLWVWTQAATPGQDLAWVFLTRVRPRHWAEDSAGRRLLCLDAPTPDCRAWLMWSPIQQLPGTTWVRLSRRFRVWRSVCPSMAGVNDFPQKIVSN